MRPVLSGAWAALALLFAAPAPAQQAAWTPPQHEPDFPPLGSGTEPAQIQASLERGPQLERGRSARWELAEHRRMQQALAALKPQRKGTVDAYVVTIGLNSDAVFGREAREAARVLARRFDAAGRTIVLAGSDGTGPSELPNGSPDSLSLALARVAELMDPNEDVLVLYATSHGIQSGVVYHDGNEGFGLLSPNRLRALFDELGMRNRLLILSSCYSGTFIPALASDTSVIVSASAPDRTSFGCAAENDWTFFGDAAINNALRKPASLATCLEEARALVWQWETQQALQPSYPQISFGVGVGAWLDPLEARMPKVASLPVGRPAVQQSPPEMVGR